MAAFEYTLIAIYVLVVLLFCGATYLEGRSKGSGWNIYRALGLSLSLVWPVVIVAIVVFAMRREVLDAEQSSTSAISEPFIL